MASRFVHTNQQSIIRGCLTAIKYYYTMYTGCEFPIYHCMIVAAGKRINRAHGMTPKKATARLCLIWSIWSQLQRGVTTMVAGEAVMWLELASSYFL